MENEIKAGGEDWMCPHYCPDGARCRLEPKHDGKHDSRNSEERKNNSDLGCTWTDEESISEEEADKIFGQTEFGKTWLMMRDILRLIAPAVNPE